MFGLWVEDIAFVGGDLNGGSLRRTGLNCECFGVVLDGITELPYDFFGLQDSVLEIWTIFADLVEIKSANPQW